MHQTPPTGALIRSPAVPEHSDDRAKDGDSTEVIAPAGSPAGGAGSRGGAGAARAHGAHRIWVRVILGVATVLAVFVDLRDLGQPSADEPDQLVENEHRAAAEADGPLRACPAT